MAWVFIAALLMGCGSSHGAAPPPEPVTLQAETAVRPAVTERSPTAEATPAPAPPDTPTQPPDPDCTRDGWCWDHPRPLGSTLRSVSGVADGDCAFAVGRDGAVLRFDGTAWARERIDGEPDLHGVHAISCDEAWAVGEAGVIAHRTATGWTSERVSSHRLRDIWVTPTGEAIAVGMAGSVVRREPSGWTVVPNFTWESFETVFGTASDDVWVAGSSRTIFHWDGSAWRQSRFLPPLRETASVVPDGGSIGDGIAFSRERVVVAFNEGLAEHTRGRWRRIPGAPDIVERMWARSPGEIYLLTFDDPVRWDGRRSFTDLGRTPVIGASAIGGTRSQVLVAGGGGGISRWDGQGWTRALGSVTYDIAAIWGTSSSDVWAIGSRGAVRRDANDWTVVPLPRIGTMYAIAGAGSEVWAGGFEGVLYRYDGSAWVAPSVAPPSQRWRRAIAVFARDAVVVAGDDRTLHFDGTRWTTHAIPETEGVLDLWGTSPTDLWAAGYGGRRGRLSHFDGSRWNRVADAAHFYVAIHGIGPGRVYVLRHDGLVMYSHDTAWTPVEGLGNGVADIWANADDDIWVVGDRGLAAHWNGTAWLREDPGTTQDLDTLWSAPDGTLYTAGHGGFILRRPPRR